MRTVTHPFTYRPDVDGLRAIAVVAVILFHARVPGFSGGFVGVDVFFVISGFLITGFILREIDGGTFSLRQFWLRRIRRIFPALFAVIAVSILAFALVYPPDLFHDFGQSLVAQAAFSTNVLFWIESGYWDTAAANKPLLHTWSLAVEEQFYVLFPVMMVLATRYLEAWRWQLIAAISLASLGVATWAAGHDPTGGFYLLPARAWELGIGALLAFAVRYRGDALPYPGLNVLLSTAGLIGLAAAIVAYDELTPFPSFYAALPCLATAALIWSNRGTPTRVGAALALRPIVFVGLLSYSLYLWHWVALVFNRALSQQAPSRASTAVALVAGTLLAYLSYVFIETPVRRNTARFTPRRLVVGTAVVMAVFASVGAASQITHGFPQRLPADVLARYDQDLQIDPACWNADLRKSETCRVGPEAAGEPRVLFWGDSHLHVMYRLVRELARQSGVPIWFSAHVGCLPVTNLHRGDLPAGFCSASSAEVINLLAHNNVTHLFLIARFNLGLNVGEELEDFRTPFFTDDPGGPVPSVEQSRAIFARELGHMVTGLRARGIEVIAVPQVPNFNVNVARHALRARLLGQTPAYRRPRAEFDARAKPFRDIIAGLDVRVLDLTPHFCDDDYCSPFRDGEALYRDDDHLSIGGALSTLPYFLDMFERLGLTGRASP